MGAEKKTKQKESKHRWNQNQTEDSAPNSNIKFNLNFQ
jgi:hypothetical protein